MSIHSSLYGISQGDGLSQHGLRLHGDGRVLQQRAQLVSCRRRLNQRLGGQRVLGAHFGLGLDRVVLCVGHGFHRFGRRRGRLDLKQRRNVVDPCCGELALADFQLVDQRVAVVRQKHPGPSHLGLVVDRPGIGHRADVHILVVVVVRRHLHRHIGQREILLRIEIIAVEPEHDGDLAPERIVNALVDRGEHLLPLLDQGERCSGSSLAVLVARQDIGDAGDLLDALDQHPQHLEQHRRRPGQLQRQDVVAQGAGGCAFHALPLARGKAHVAAAYFRPAGNEAALHVGQGSSIYKLVDDGVDRSPQIIRERAEANIVERAVRRRNEAVLGEILLALNTHDAKVRGNVAGFHRFLQRDLPLAPGNEYPVRVVAGDDPRHLPVGGQGHNVRLRQPIAVHVHQPVLLEHDNEAVRVLPILALIGDFRPFL